MKLPKVIDANNIQRVRKEVAKIALDIKTWNKAYADPKHWMMKEVTLEFPTGEIARDWLTTMALIGREKPEPVAITGKERFNAQGLEGKIQVRKPLINALANTDLMDPWRWRIVTK